MAKMTVDMKRIRSTAIEVGLYLPLGIYSRARDEITDLDARRVRKAFGDLIDRGEDRVRPLERRLRRRVDSVRSDAKSPGGRPKKSTKTTARRSAGSAKKTAARKSTGSAKKTSARKSTGSANKATSGSSSS